MTYEKFKPIENYPIKLEKYEKALVEWYKRPFQLQHTCYYKTHTPEERQHTAKYTKPQKIGRQWQIEDYCKYCTTWLIETEEDPCIQCGIREAINDSISKL